jgi:hypothetical protein
VHNHDVHLQNETPFSNQFKFVNIPGEIDAQHSHQSSVVGFHAKIRTQLRFELHIHFLSLSSFGHCWSTFHFFFLAPPLFFGFVGCGHGKPTRENGGRTVLVSRHQNKTNSPHTASRATERTERTGKTADWFDRKISIFFYFFSQSNFTFFDKICRLEQTSLHLR